MPADMPMPSNVVQFALAVATMTDGSIWGQAQALLYANEPTVFAGWIAGLVLLSNEGGDIVLKAPLAFNANYVSNHQTADILMALCRFEPETISLEARPSLIESFCGILLFLEPWFTLNSP